MPTADEATQFASLLKTQTTGPQVKNFVDKLDILSDGVDASVSVAMSSAKLTAIIGMVGAMMPHAGGGPGATPTPPAMPAPK
jgi:hypothetical protein